MQNGHVGAFGDDADRRRMDRDLVVVQRDDGQLDERRFQAAGQFRCIA